MFRGIGTSLISLELLFEQLQHSVTCLLLIIAQRGMKQDGNIRAIPGTVLLGIVTLYMCVFFTKIATSTLGYGWVCRTMTGARLLSRYLRTNKSELSTKIMCYNRVSNPEGF